MKELLEPVVGPSILKKKQYHCKKCSSVEHHSATCPQIDPKNHARTKKLTSGVYIISVDLAEIFEEFLMTYYDLVDFNNTTSDPLRTIVVRETLNNPKALKLISSTKGAFLEYLMCHCTQESN
jgi:hypothetical protein